MVTIIKKGTPASKLKKLFEEARSKIKKKDIRKYAGILKSETQLDPIEYQKKMRNEWE